MSRRGPKQYGAALETSSAAAIESPMLVGQDQVGMFAGESSTGAQEQPDGGGSDAPSIVETPLPVSVAAPGSAAPAMPAPVVPPAPPTASVPVPVIPADEPWPRAFICIHNVGRVPPGGAIRLGQKDAERIMAGGGIRPLIAPVPVPAQK
jgi:hypothetical protein